MPTRRLSVPGTLIVAITLILGVVGAFAVGAQDAATPDPVVDATPLQIERRPAHIHAGSCDEPGETLYLLRDVSTVPADAVQPPGAVGQSATTIQASLDALVGAERTIDVHAGPEDPAHIIACGNLSGAITDGQLPVTLEEVNGSGYRGEAGLVAHADGTISVTVALLQVDARATPAATPEQMAQPSGAAYGIGSVLVTTIDGLRLRTEPSTGAEALTSLPAGTEVQVIAGPEAAEGFTWYEVEVRGADEPTSGWMATGADFVDPVPQTGS